MQAQNAGAHRTVVFIFTPSIASANMQQKLAGHVRTISSGQLVGADVGTALEESSAPSLAMFGMRLSTSFFFRKEIEWVQEKE